MGACCTPPTIDCCRGMTLLEENISSMVELEFNKTNFSTLAIDIVLIPLEGLEVYQAPDEPWDKY